MTSEKAKDLVNGILKRTTEGNLKWIEGPGDTFLAAVAGQLSLSFHAGSRLLTVSGSGGHGGEILIHEWAPRRDGDVAVDTDLVVPEVGRLGVEIERSLKKDVEQRVDEFLSILAKS